MCCAFSRSGYSVGREQCGVACGWHGNSEQQPVPRALSKAQIHARQELKGLLETLMPQLNSHGIALFGDVSTLRDWATAEPHQRAGWSDDEVQYLIQFNDRLLELDQIDPAHLKWDAAGTGILTRQQQESLAGPLSKLLKLLD
jgi:hypothetical protein